MNLGRLCSPREHESGTPLRIELAGADARKTRGGGRKRWLREVRSERVRNRDGYVGNRVWMQRDAMICFHAALSWYTLGDEASHEACRTVWIPRCDPAAGISDLARARSKR